MENILAKYFLHIYRYSRICLIDRGAWMESGNSIYTCLACPPCVGSMMRCGLMRLCGRLVVMVIWDRHGLGTLG